jgi:hypothetical protein
MITLTHIECTYVICTKEQFAVKKGFSQFTLAALLAAASVE